MARISKVFVCTAGQSIYNRLYKKVRRKKMITASLVLEGGATRGVFTAGAVDYLMERGLYFSHVIGVSAGSCNAVDYVSRQLGRSRDCWIHKEKEYDYYYKIRDFMKEKSIMNMDMVFNQYPNQVYPFDYDTYFDSEMVCEITVTNCKTGKAEYLTEEADRARLMSICRASCSMPLVSPVVTVDGEPYLDGGLADSVPLRRAVEIGNKKIIIFLTRAKGYRKSYLLKGETKLYKRVYGAYPNLVKTIVRRPLAYNRTMDLIERLEEEGHIFVLRPGIKPVKRLEKNYDTLMNFYEHGYKLMENQFERLQEYLQKQPGKAYDYDIF